MNLKLFKYIKLLMLGLYIFSGNVTQADEVNIVSAGEFSQGKLDAVVLMSDADNTKKEVTAYYGDISFSKK